MLTFRQYFEDLGSPETVFVGKGLTKEEAWKKAFKKATKDFRGMKYDEKTGKVTLH